MTLCEFRVFRQADSHKFRERGLSAYSRQGNFASPSLRGDPLSKFYVI